MIPFYDFLKVDRRLKHSHDKDFQSEHFDLSQNLVLRLHFLNYDSYNVGLYSSYAIKCEFSKNQPLLPLQK